MVLSRKARYKSNYHESNIRKVLFYRRLKSVTRRLFVYFFFGFSVIFTSLLFFKEGFLEELNKNTKNFYLKFIEQDFHYKTVVTGNKYTSEDRIIQIVKNSYDKYLKTLQSDSEINSLMENDYNVQVHFLEIIRHDLQKEKWIRDVHIKRQFPDKLMLNIIEYRPYVIWQNKGILKLVDDDGTVIPVERDTIKEFSDLIVVVCDEGAIKNDVREIFNILILDPFIILDIESLNRVGNRRWNVVFRNGVVIKLPEKDTGKAWQKVIELYNSEGVFMDLESIDLRVQDKVYFEYKKKTAREIKRIK